jgi:hypothetical protein
LGEGHPVLPNQGEGEDLELNVPERVALLELLADVEGNFLTLKILRKLREELSFSEEEIKEFNLVELGGKITWERGADKDVKMGNKAREIAVDALKRRDAAGTLRDRHFTLYEKMVPPEAGDTPLSA